MDNNSTAAICFALFGALSAAQQILTAASSIIDDVPTSSEKRLDLKRRRELTPYKWNVAPRSETPVSILQPINVLQHILQDENCEYIKKTTHVHSWQCFELATNLKPLIERPRSGGPKLGKASHHDYCHRFCFALVTFIAQEKLRLVGASHLFIVTWNMS
jgi:hypothetical protein